ncbi:hypothetical protein ABZP36_033969 [Zizania latifolia]
MEPSKPSFSQGGRKMYVRDFDLNKEPSPDPDETPGTISFTAPSASPVLQQLVAVEADEKSAAKTVVPSSSGEDAKGASSSAGLKGNSQPPAPEETICSSSSTQLPDVAVHAPLGTRATAQRIVANIVASRRVASRERDQKHG